MPDDQKATESKPAYRADVTTVKAYAKAKLERERIEAKLKDIKARMEAMEPSISEYFQRQGMQSMNVGGYTVYLRRELWASLQQGVDPAKLETEVAGTEFAVAVAPRMNVQTMSALMREREEQMKQQGTKPNDLQHVIPAELRGLLKLAEIFKVGVRKSAKAKG